MKIIKENIINIFYKLIFVIEFILCTLAIITILNLIVYKSEYGTWELKYIIGITCTGIIIIALMYLGIKKYNKHIEKMFLLFAIPIGLLYMIFLIPTFAPDENYHAYRAYQVSEGEFIVKINDDGKTDTLISQDLIHAGIDRRCEHLFNIIR